MDFSLTENHREVEALAKQLLSEIASEERHRELDKLDDRFDAKAWKVLGESGLLAVWLDEAHGGAGMSLIEWAAIAEAVGRRAAAIPFVSASIAAMAIARFGSAAQQAAHLPGFAAGTHMLAYGNAGLRQVAPGFAVGCVVKTASGDRLTGYWTGIAGGMQAHALLLSALDEAGNTRLYIIPTAGLERVAQPGTSDETLAAVTLTDFAVTAEQELCGGEEALAQITELARLGNAAVMLGCASEALKLTGEYAKTRHQFDVPIGTFQAVQQRAGDAYIDLAAIRASFWQAAWRAANGAKASREVAIAAFWAADGGHRIVSAAQHIHGGMGFDRDYPLHRNYLQFKQCEFALGGASALLAELGDLIAAPTSR